MLSLVSAPFVYADSIVSDGEMVEIVLPEKKTESLTFDILFQGEVLTVNLKEHSVFGKNTRFLVSDTLGKTREVEHCIDATYLGNVTEKPSYTVGAVLTEFGLLANITRPNQSSITIEPAYSDGASWHRIFENAADDHIACGHAECQAAEVEEESEPELEAHSQQEPKEFESVGPITTVFSTMATGMMSGGSTATLPPTRVMDVLEYEVGVEIGSRAFLNNYGGAATRLASAQASAASIAVNMDARYLRGAGIKHVVGTVIIRQTAAADPFTVNNGTDRDGLSAFRNHWNSNPGEVGTTHDLAVYHVRGAPSGLANVNQVGTSLRYALSASNGPTSWASGTLVHEFGHTWGLLHNNDAPILDYENEDYVAGVAFPNSFYEARPRNNNGMNSAGGSHTFISVMNGSGDHNIGRLSTDEANRVFGVRQTKRFFGDIVTDPGPIPPFGHRDLVTASRAGSVIADVIANDYDANNDVLDVEILDTVSQKGGTITLSQGTGPGGRNQLIYTPPSGDGNDIDFFHYTVVDSTGQRDFGCVHVNIIPPLLFAESFSYPAGALENNTNAGNAWDSRVFSGSTIVEPLESLPDLRPETLLKMGGKVVQIGSHRRSLPLPEIAWGGQDNSVRYISFIQKLASSATNQSRVVEFWNGSSTTNNTTFSFGTNTWPGAPDYGLFLDQGGANVPFEVGTADMEPHLIVIKVEYGTNGDDRIKLYRDPGQTEPTLPDVNHVFPNLDFNRIGFGSFQGGSQEVDEFRIGTTYESVIPLEQSELIFEESFTYESGELAGERNNGNAWQDDNENGGSNVSALGSLSPNTLTNLITSGGRVEQIGNDRYSLPLSDSSGEAHTVRYISFVQKLGTVDIGKSQLLEFWNGRDASFSFGTNAWPGSPDYGLFLNQGGGEVPFEAGAPSTESRLIVLKVEYGADDADAIRAYVSPGETEPEIPDALGFFTDLSFDRLGFAAFQGATQEVDEIRIGATYRDVVPLITNDPHFEENFEYSDGALAGNQNDGSTWSNASGSGASVSTGSLLVEQPVGFVTSGGKANQTNGQRVSIPLPTRARGGSDNSTVYVSFVQDLVGVNTNQTRIVEFWDGSPTDSSRTFSFGTFVDAVPNAPGYGIFVERGNTQLAREIGAEVDRPRLIVLKINYGTNDMDTMEVFFDPGESEPLVPLETITTTNLAFNRIGFGSFQGGAQSIDSFRIGGTYASVVPSVNPDSDGDGLPDDFERTYYDSEDLSVTDGTEDLDGDGQSDAAEFIAGTDAAERESVFALTQDGVQSVSETEVSISWKSVTGITYSIWTSESLAPDSWTELIPSVSANGEVTTAVVTRSGATRFYQVRVNP